MQELLLEIGWNKSDSVRKDLERSLDCCDFSEVNYSGICEAVGITWFYLQSPLKEAAIIMCIKLFTFCNSLHFWIYVPKMLS